MSGHSKWSTIKRKKGATDARRGKIFTKLIREISTAASISGGDPDANPRLRLSIEKARQANMPKDNIERAIKKGVGAGDAGNFEAVAYEGYGPGGTAIYVETLTDNKNRTVGEIRHVLTRYGGNLGANGCVAYLFSKKGFMVFDREGLDPEALFEAAIEAGASDVVESEDSFEVVTEPGVFESAGKSLTEQGFSSAESDIRMEPSTTVSLSGKDAETMLNVADSLEDLDDVQNVYANFDISEEEMARIADS